ncbi:hypothetical protein LSH36_1206g00003 [Paralvinella palmiformis]|uniref:Uncharacterized protein n=1 Tax=Paralvinella palmiformis TaxID=53620 RepID=A0AAD9MP50_9ANNE|nr:hypothetical protein LSH36_1206g00003 [Paralvinella palmiformis]
MKTEGQLSSSGPVNVRHLQLLNFGPNKDVFPPDKASFLSLIEEMHNWQEQQKDSQNHKINDKMIIHCMDGVTRSGLFCGASHIIQQINLNQEVDPFMAARYVSIRRQQFFQTQEEYNFLFNIGLEYMSRNHDYVEVE